MVSFKSFIIHFVTQFLSEDADESCHISAKRISFYVRVVFSLQTCYTEAANQRSAGRAPAETKRCRRCGSTKEAADFYISKMTADGLQSYCKACYAVASAQRRSRNHQDQACRQCTSRGK